MGSKHKQSRMEQKASFERRLKDRLSYLSKKGIESPKIDKDVLVKKLRADIKAVNTRLKAIADNEKRTEDLARIKAEKAAAPKEDQKGSKDKKSKEAPAEGKEKADTPKEDQEGGKDKKSKEVSAEGKEKAAAPKKDQEGGKVKKSKEAPAEGKEKAAAPKKDQEGGKVKKSKEAPAEGKEKKKKKEDNPPEATE